MCETDRDVKRFSSKKHYVVLNGSEIVYENQMYAQKKKESIWIVFVSRFKWMTFPEKNQANDDDDNLYCSNEKQNPKSLKK